MNIEEKRQEFINYLVDERKMFVLNPGKDPYYMSSYGNKSLDWDENDYTLTLWMSNFPANLEMSNVGEGKFLECCVYDISDLKTLLYLTRDCLKDGRPEKIKNLVL